MDLLQRFALGEIDAFETLVRQFQGEIYAWVVRTARDPGIAEDLTIETLWRIYRARQQFRPDGSCADCRGGSPPIWHSTISAAKVQNGVYSWSLPDHRARSSRSGRDAAEDSPGISPIDRETSGDGDSRSRGRATL